MTISNVKYLENRSKSNKGKKNIVRWGLALTTFFLFLVDEGERIQIPLKAGQHWPTSGTPFLWRFANKGVHEKSNEKTTTKNNSSLDLCYK